MTTPPSHPPSHPPSQPPRFSERLLQALFPDNGTYSTLGDLEEVYHHLAASKGVAAARRWYRWQALRSIGPSTRNAMYWHAVMLKNYFVSAARHLRQHRFYTAINIVGLAVALSFGILALLFIRSETTFDQFHDDSELIFRAATAVHFQELEYWENTPFPLADAITSEIPGLASVARFTNHPRRPIRIAGKQSESDLYLASAAFFDMFRFPLRVGNTADAMSNPQSMIISREVQLRQFPDTNPIGETVYLNLSGSEFLPFTVAGVAATIPENSSIRFDYLIPESNYAAIFGSAALTDWLPKSRTVTFIKTESLADLETVQSGLDQLALAHGLDRFIGEAVVEHLIAIEPLEDVHFSTLIENKVLAPNGDASYAFSLGAVALLVLLIACINFMNLSVGMSAGRSKEVGVRKVLGAKRSQLVHQFWFESMILSVGALVLAIGVTFLMLPTFNSIAGKHLVFDVTRNLQTVGVLVALTIVIGIVAGSYPALVLSGFRPSTVLKGTFRLGGRSLFSRLLVTAQFAISIFLIVTALVMARQLRHMTTLDPGYNSEHLLLQELPRGVDEQTVARYREAALQVPNVVGVTAARATLFGDMVGSAMVVQHNDRPLTLAVNKIDFEFLDVLGIPLVAGRNLSADYSTDPTDAVLVNESFVEFFELTNPVGRRAPFGGENDPTIVGVVSDFHYMSLRNTIGPLILNLRPDSDFRQIITRVRGTSMRATIASLEETWATLDTGTLFNYTFIDETLRNQYSAEQNFRAISTYAAWMATFIACLGLFGLAALSVARRTKEMGIRKVLGASMGRILYLFNREYLILLAIATVIAWPAARFVLDKWLERYAYSIVLDWSAFAAATIVVFALAVLTVSWQAQRAARRNPVDSLRYE